jgi:probable rRNA maturation factor
MSPECDNLVLFRRTPRKLKRAQLRRFALRLFEEVAGKREFTCLVTDDRELRRLNREFLGKDFPADVLSFPASDASGLAPFLGEIAISANRADEQAAADGHPIEEEAGILMLHGLLHLMGMDHASDRGEMKRAEKRWRAMLGLPATLIERSGL